MAFWICMLILVHVLILIGLLDGRVLATDIYGVANGIKNADGILCGGSHMVNVQKNLSPDPW